MTNEERLLLLKDLCARLPYGVITKNCKKNSDVPAHLLPHVNGIKLLIAEYDLKPYLRPMSSMTEEEKNDLRNEHIKDEQLFTQCIAESKQGDNTMRGKVIPHFAADWCNKNHFDYRGLIPMGLALPAEEGMYNN